MRKDSWVRGALLSVLVLAGLVLLAVAPAEAQYCCFNEEADATNNGDSDEDDKNSSSGNDATQNPLGGDLGGSPAPNVPQESPKGAFVWAKKKLVKKIWNSLTGEQQRQAINLLQDWLEEKGFSSCHDAATDPSTARDAANQVLASDDLQLSDGAKDWINRLLGMSSGKGISNTVIIICNELGL